MRLALIRHPALRVAPGICYGRRNFPVADPADIPKIVDGLGEFCARVVFASPAGRCRALAEAILGPVTYDPRLLELDFGEWEGVAWDDIDRTAFDRWAADPVENAPPGGETGQSLIDRVTAFFLSLPDLEHHPIKRNHRSDKDARENKELEQFRAPFSAERALGDTAIVTHGGPLKVLLGLARNNPIDLAAPSVPLGSITVINRSARSSRHRR